MRKKDPDHRQYEVGYRRPPKHTRWAPGQSGNAKGRPEGSQNFATVVSRLARQPMTVKEGGRSRRVSRLEALYLTLWAQAYKGSVKACAEIRQSLRDAGLLRFEDRPGEDTITPDDQAIVADYLKQLGVKQPKTLMRSAKKKNPKPRTTRASKEVKK